MYDIKAVYVRYVRRYNVRMDNRNRRAAEQIGSNFRSWRKLLGLTAQQVADRAHVSRQAVSRLENGEPVSYETLLAVSRALGIVERIIEATDPWETDLGRLRADDALPKRVRNRG